MKPSGAGRPTLGGRSTLGLLGEYGSQIAAVEAEVLAEHVMGNGDTRRAERLLDDGKTSKREQRKKAKRARTVDRNKALADKLGSGAMSEEQVDVIADAADKTDGAAAVDAELIDKVAAVPPEQGKSIADKYVADKKTAGGMQSEHDRQRALRRASKYHSKKHGLDIAAIEGDGVAIKAMWDAIADSVLADYAAHADIFAALYDRNGEPLWLQRLERYATPTQLIAVILRDNGCVLCGADPSSCQAHHTLPYNAPGKGRTNLDELVLLCGRCHRQLHTNQQTIYQDNTGAWRTRPAMPNETPPPRPTTNRNQVRRE